MKPQRAHEGRKHWPAEHGLVCREKGRGSTLPGVWQAVSVSGWNTSDLLTPPLCRCVSAGSCVAQLFTTTSSSSFGRISCLFCLTKKQTKKSVPPPLSFLLLSPFPVLKTANGGSHAHQGPGWRYLRQPPPTAANTAGGAAPELPPPLAVSVQTGRQEHGEPLLWMHASFGTDGSCEGNHCSHALGLRNARVPLNPAPFLFWEGGGRSVFRKWCPALPRCVVLCNNSLGTITIIIVSY